MRSIPYAVAAALLLVAGCGSPGTPAAAPSPTPSPTPTPASSAPPAPTSPATSTSAPKPSASPAPHHEPTTDPRWRFFTDDTHWYTSPWFAGTHRIMIGFGCNASPWYDHDPRCPGTEGFHHGIDVAMPCGTVLRAGIAGTVLPPGAPGTPGPAYGVNPFRIRIQTQTGAYDVLIGHTRTVYVKPGQHVRRGQRIALASDSGAPDGCHLHFEVRPPGGGYQEAIDPREWLMLSPA